MKKLIFVIIGAFLLSGISYSQWYQVSIPGDDSVYCFTSVNSNIYAGCKNDLYRSTNYGLNWMSSGTGLYYKPIYTMGNKNLNIFLGSNNIYKSSDFGVNWFTINHQFGGFLAYSFLFLDTFIYCGVSSGILRTNNDGINWTLLYNGLNTQDVKCLTNSGINIFAGTNTGIYKSSNNGDNWSINSFQGDTVNSFAQSGLKMFAGISNLGVYLTTDNGVTWNSFINGLTNPNVNSILVYSNYLIAGTDNGIYISSVNLNNWTPINQGFTTIPKIKCMMLSGNYLYTGTFGQSVWRRLIADIIGIKKINTKLPANFSLSQNDPNPFNPNTLIKFKIKESGFVTLKVYNILGKEVSTLVNENLITGEYVTTFDGSGLSSGIYFYRLNVGDFSQTKKMTLLK